MIERGTAFVNKLIRSTPVPTVDVGTPHAREWCMTLSRINFAPYILYTESCGGKIITIHHAGDRDTCEEAERQLSVGDPR